MFWQKEKGPHLVKYKHWAYEHIGSRLSATGEETCLHIGLTGQWPLVNANGSQSLSQAPQRPIMKSQPGAMRGHFKVTSLLHDISQLLQQQGHFTSWSRAILVWVKLWGTISCCILNCHIGGNNYSARCNKYRLPWVYNDTSLIGFNQRSLKLQTSSNERKNRDRWAAIKIQVTHSAAGIRTGIWQHVCLCLHRKSLNNNEQLWLRR